RGVRQRLVHRDPGITEPADALLVAEGLPQRLAEDDRGVLDGVVGVDVGVPAGLDPQVERGVRAQRVEHVVVERHTGVDLDLAGPVEVQFDQHRRFLRGALDLADPAARLECGHWLISSRTALLAARKASFSSGVPTVTRRWPGMPTSRMSTSASR